jgi:hypothetical protein
MENKHENEVNELSNKNNNINLSEEEVKAFVGPRSDYYYKSWYHLLANSKNSGVPALDYFAIEAKNWPPNIGAILLGPTWLAYRKMYFGSFILFIASYGLSTMLSEVFGLPYISANIASAAIYASLGNSMYLRHAKKEIALIKRRGLEHDEYIAALNKRGGTNILGAIIASILLLCLVLLLSVAENL